MKKTPLYDKHVSLGAKMVPFAGFDMPVQYSGVTEEHFAVREKAGMFDVSHMGQFMIEGPGSVELLQYVANFYFLSLKLLYVSSQRKWRNCR